MAISRTRTPHHTEKSQFKGRLARSMVLALLLFSMLPLLIMGTSAYIRSSNLLKEQASEQLQNIAQSNAQEIRDGIKVKQIRLALIGKQPAFKYPAWAAFISNTSRFREDAIAAFAQYNTPEGNAYFQDFMVVDTNGIIRLSSRLDWENLNISSTPYFSKFKEGTHSFALFDLSPILSNRFVILTVSPYYDNQDQEKGYLVGITGEETVKNIITQAESFNQEAKAFFALENDIFIQLDPHTKTLSLFTPSSEERNEIISIFPEENNQSDTVAATLNYTNAQNILVTSEVLWIPEIESSVVVELPQSQIFSQLNSLAPFTITLFIVTLLSMGAVIIVSINRMVKPLLSLTETTQRFADGDWSERSPIKRTDEIGLLSYSFNNMADELSSLYQSLEQRVEERAQQLRTAAEVAQEITSTRHNADELLQQTTDLISDRFGYFHTGIFLLDRAGRYAVLRAAHSPQAKVMLGRGHRLAVGSPSLVGWVADNGLPRVATAESDDPTHFKNEFLPDALSEAGIPIMAGGQVLGVLNVQSQDQYSFDAEAIITLQTLAGQVAAALQNIALSESAQVNFQELDILYRASQQISQAHSWANVLDRTSAALRQTSFITALYLNESGKMSLSHAFNPDDPNIQIPSGMYELQTSVTDLSEAMATGAIITELGRASTAPAELTRVLRQMGCKSAAFLPIGNGEKLYGIMALGTAQTNAITPATMQPYLSLADTVTTTLDKISAEEIIQRRLNDLEAITSATQNISAVDNLNTLYSVLHDQIRQNLGDYNFLIALYETQGDRIAVPYMYEGGRVSTLEPFPLGEGLTSILIRTRQPLMLVEETEKRSVALGAKVVGKPAKSWLGAPLLIGHEAVGAIIVQDTENEFAFSEHDLRFITALATQAAGAINNVRLLEDSRNRSLQLETAAEIARDVGSALDLDELLARAIQLISSRLNFYHVGVFLLDALNEYAVIREATGEAGAQMKRARHKLKVGSKSIVGYVAGQGESLVVNDTSKDATHYNNPLLPDTRAEAAIPLKVGERIVGVIDVQSTTPYTFTDEAMRTLSILADQLAVAVINSELFAETQEHLSQHRLLHHITTSAASGTTLDEALESAVHGLQVTLGGDRVAILLADTEKATLEIKSSIGYSEADTENLSIPVGSGVTGWVAAHRTPLRISHVGDDSRYIQVSADTKSELALPLIFRNELLGVLNVESEIPAAYDDHDEEMLGTLAGSLAAIIANARLLEQIRRQVDRDRLLFEVTSKIRRSTDMKTILQTTASELNKVVGARRTQIRIEPEKPESTETK